MNKRGFTLLEVLAVISVMVILAGIVLPSLRTSRGRAFEARTEAQLASVALALKLYRADMGVFPSQVTLWTLVEGVAFGGGPSLGARWRGPYIELKGNRDVNLTTGALLDAWGRAIRYTRHSTLVDGRWFDLSSDGPDGVFNNTDDVRQWES